MRSSLAAATLAAVAASSAAEAQLTASFIDGTYVTSAKACAQLKALAKGGNRNLNTVPWTLDKKGFSSWEGGCGFAKITERKKGREWAVEADCHEGPEENKETYLFRRASPTTLVITLTTKGATAEQRKPETYTRCDTK
jgi:hypothetical protein